MIRLNPFRLAAACLVAACVGCPGSLEDPGRFTSATGTCPDVPQDVFIKTCSATVGCHSATDKQLGLDLQSPDVASRLVGVKATGGTGLLIDPSNPAASVVYTKLTAMPPFGARMPFTQPPLDDATIACVLQWITTQVTDGGADGAVSEAASDDGPATMGDDGSPPSDDGPTSDDGSTQPDTGGSPPPPPVDAGRDARAPKDASSPPPDASSVKDSGGTPPADASGE